ncbi:MAG: hypothetical protein FJ042_00600 [Candidatus Cloacimonetes bacterium]|nr:hypothetical protein [Candidatus Cloacimonadota bacterium]
MASDQRGFSVYTVISIILFLALVAVLALPSFFNLDKTKNEEDCLNNMKAIWVGTIDYLRDYNQDFSGDLTVLLNTPKRHDQKKNTYLNTITKCPESRGKDKTGYIVFGKYVADRIGEEVKHNFGAIVICPNLTTYPKHMIPKQFYENMEPTQLQNYMIDDIDYIDQQTGSNGRLKKEKLLEYINIWQTDPDAFTKRRGNSTVFKDLLFPQN